MRCSYHDSQWAAQSAQHISAPEAAGSRPPPQKNSSESLFFAITVQKVRRLFDTSNRAARLMEIKSKEVY